MSEIMDAIDGYKMSRWHSYKAVLDLWRREFQGREVKVLEVGESNGIIRLIFEQGEAEYIVAEHPEFDAQQLPNGWSGEFDAVVLDQVLEHVPKPERAIEETHRVLKPGGWAIVATPFLVCEHGRGGWGDYWRFTVAGLRVLLGEYFSPAKTETGSWGNADFISVANECECSRLRQPRARDWIADCDMANDARQAYTIWALAQK
jgi:SAM-dependent methyltransferase